MCTRYLFKEPNRTFITVTRIAYCNKHLYLTYGILNIAFYVHTHMPQYNANCHEKDSSFCIIDMTMSHNTFAVVSSDCWYISTNHSII